MCIGVDFYLNFSDVPKNYSSFIIFFHIFNILINFIVSVLICSYLFLIFSEYKIFFFGKYDEISTLTASDYLLFKIILKSLTKH